MRTVGVVTAGRSDYGIYLPFLYKIKEDPDLELHLIVSGAHLSSEFGHTIDHILSDGFKVGDQVEMLLSSDTPQAISKSMGIGVIGFAESYARFRPDILVVLGDRFEMHSAALAALPFKIPVVHIHGGELTLGAIDDALRHSITKISHFHFTSTIEYAQRVIQLGEEPWRVVTCGALSLDNFRNARLLNREEVATSFGLFLPEEFLLVTYHPVTLEFENTEWQVVQLLYAIEDAGLPVLFTLPNADTGGRQIWKMINDYIEKHPDWIAVENLGTVGYFSAMQLASAMVGNSSSGIVEAGLFHLPVVNVGTRQSGRIRSKNIIDVGYKRNEILKGIKKALEPEFKQHLKDFVSPYGNGHASEIILKTVKNLEIGDRLLVKKFYDIPNSEWESRK